MYDNAHWTYESETRVCRTFYAVVHSDCLYSAPAPVVCHYSDQPGMHAHSSTLSCSCEQVSYKLKLLPSKHGLSLCVGCEMWVTFLLSDNNQ